MASLWYSGPDPIGPYIEANLKSYPKSFAREEDVQEAIANGIGTKKYFSKKTCLLIVDMQKSFIDQTDLETASKKMANQLDMLAWAKNNSLPLYVLEVKYLPHTDDRIKEAAEELDTTYIYRYRNPPSGFTKTDPADKLKSKGIENIIIMGAFSGQCVKATVRSALQSGFKIYTSEELLIDHPENNHENIMKWYKENSTFTENRQQLLEKLPNN